MPRYRRCRYTRCGPQSRVSHEGRMVPASGVCGRRFVQQATAQLPWLQKCVCLDGLVGANLRCSGHERAP